ncbi:FAD-dependent oxidoreductase [Ktedonobacteria bacterium brp13]|nr:FAD-dependent oxidoreductase [Ktedonobacteria bacterium brp13]
MNNKLPANPGGPGGRSVAARAYLQRSLGQADVVVVGNGIAGLTAAIEARRLAPDKSVVIITDQTHPTINTPALKQFAIGKLAREQLLAYPAGTERAERIHIVNTRVDEIHARSKYVTLRGGHGFGYGSLLLATGSAPTGLAPSIPGANFDGVLTLHRLQDYLDLRRRIGEVNEAVVIGGGVHAIETVMGLLYWGIRVHWLIRGKTFMRNMLDETSSTLVLNNIQRAGAQVYLETEVSGIMGRVGAVAGIITNHSKMIPCQLVLCCVGTQPTTTLAEQCSIPMLLQHGIMVDDKLRTSVRDIYAAGDVASLKNPQSGTFEPRAQWYAATAQGRIAGAMMVGKQEQTPASFGIYWHATHLGELSMLTVGEPLSKDTKDTKDTNIQILTDSSKSDYRRVALSGDRLVGYLALGTEQPDSLAIKRIIEEGISVRDVIKPLLKGQFDARAYLARQHSRTTRDLLTGRAPALARQQNQPVVEYEIFPTVSRQQTDPLKVHEETPVSSAQGRQRQTDQLGMPQAQPERAATPQAMYEYEAQTRYNRGTNQPLPQFEMLVDEINPFTGNLPELSQAGMYDDEIDASYRRGNNDPLLDTPPIEPENTALRYKLWAYMGNEE